MRRKSSLDSCCLLNVVNAPVIDAACRGGLSILGVRNLKGSCLEHSNFELQWPSDAQNRVQSAPAYTSHRSSRRFCGSGKDVFQKTELKLEAVCDLSTVPESC